MILDTSAIAAIVFQEPEYERVLDLLGKADHVGIGSPTLVETALVLSARLGRDARGMIERFLQEASVVVVPFGNEHYSMAVDAWLQFGKGRHPASLNLGDCFSYATARLAGQALLCVGFDFSKTDLNVVGP